MFNSSLEQLDLMADTRVGGVHLIGGRGCIEIVADDRNEKMQML